MTLNPTSCLGQARCMGEYWDFHCLHYGQKLSEGWQSGLRDALGHRYRYRARLQAGNAEGSLDPGWCPHPPQLQALLRLKVLVPRDWISGSRL